MFTRELSKPDFDALDAVLNYIVNGTDFRFDDISQHARLCTLREWFKQSHSATLLFEGDERDEGLALDDT